MLGVDDVAATQNVEPFIMDMFDDLPPHKT
jgi:hypothetical protein